MENPIRTFQCHSTEKFRNYCNRNTGIKGQNTQKGLSDLFKFSQLLNDVRLSELFIGGFNMKNYAHA